MMPRNFIMILFVNCRKSYPRGPTDPPIPPGGCHCQGIQPFRRFLLRTQSGETK